MKLDELAQLRNRIRGSDPAQLSIEPAPTPAHDRGQFGPNTGVGYLFWLARQDPVRRGRAWRGPGPERGGTHGPLLSPGRGGGFWFGGGRAGLMGYVVKAWRA